MNVGAGPKYVQVNPFSIALKEKYAHLDLTQYYSYIHFARRRLPTPLTIAIPDAANA
jgi:hypothetical protein